MRPLTVCTGRRAFWPIYVTPGSGCPVRRSRPGCAGIGRGRDQSTEVHPGTTRPSGRPAPTDLVGRLFDRDSRVGCGRSDITYPRTGEGWLYLCAVRDGCTRRVIGWAVDDHMRADLVQAALSMAVTLRGTLAAEVILHADRGSQYTSAQMARFARQHNLVHSVGRTAVCWDNAPAESFWATLKIEFYDRHDWPSRADAKLAVGDWIETGSTTGAGATPPSVCSPQ